MSSSEKSDEMVSDIPEERVEKEVMVDYLVSGGLKRKIGGDIYDAGLDNWAALVNGDEAYFREFKGVGKKTAELLIELGVRKKDDLKKREERPSLREVLESVPRVTESVVDSILENGYDSFGKFRNLDADELKKLKGIGPKLSVSVIEAVNEAAEKYGIHDDFEVEDAVASEVSHEAAGEGTDEEAPDEEKKEKGFFEKIIDTIKSIFGGSSEESDASEEGSEEGKEESDQGSEQAPSGDEEPDSKKEEKEDPDSGEDIGDEGSSSKEEKKDEKEEPSRTEDEDIGKETPDEGDAGEKEVADEVSEEETSDDEITEEREEEPEEEEKEEKKPEEKGFFQKIKEAIFGPPGDEEGSEKGSEDSAVDDEDETRDEGSVEEKKDDEGTSSGDEKKDDDDDGSLDEKGEGPLGLSGIPDDIQERLREAGYLTRDELREAVPEDLIMIEGIDKDTAERICDAAGK